MLLLETFENFIVEPGSGEVFLLSKQEILIDFEKIILRELAVPIWYQTWSEIETGLLHCS